MADGDGPARTFGSISLAGQSGGSGALSITKGGFGWKARDAGRQVSVQAADVVSLQWVRGGRGQQIRIRLKGGATTRFEGFRESDHAGLDEFFVEVLGKKLDRGSQAVRGWSWGQIDFVSQGTPSLVFNAGGGNSAKNKATELEEAFDIPIGTVANVQLPNKNELAIDVHVDDTAGKMDEELVEMRFYIPDEDEAEELLSKVKARADTSAFAGDSICSFSEVGIVVPRGRFEVDLFPNHIKLHGKSVDFKILYSSVTRLFLLPKPDDVLVSFVMSLDPPIRQGNTMYPHIVFQFDTDQRSDVRLNVSPGDLAQKYKGKLKPNESDETWRVFSKIMKHLSSSPLHVPKAFKTSKGAYAVRTALGANEGFLFFLESCCFFVNKPPTYIRYDDMDMVEFKRLDLDRRFDMSVQLASGSTLLFSNIDRTEFDLIFKFLQKKEVPIDNADALARSGGRVGQVDMTMLASDGDSEESDDEDFDPAAAAKAAKAVDAAEAAAGGGSAGAGVGAGDSEDDDDDFGGDNDDAASSGDDMSEGVEDKTELLDLVGDQGDDAPKKKRKKK
jgi:structure-specific recognition protein 1